MSDAEIGAMVRRALEREGVLATLTIRRGHDGGGGPFVATLHVYGEHADGGGDPDETHPELGIVRDGTHQTERGATLVATLRLLDLGNP